MHFTKQKRALHFSLSLKPHGACCFFCAFRFRKHLVCGDRKVHVKTHISFGPLYITRICFCCKSRYQVSSCKTSWRCYSLLLALWLLSAKEAPSFTAKVSLHFSFSRLVLSSCIWSSMWSAIPLTFLSWLLLKVFSFPFWFNKEKVGSRSGWILWFFLLWPQRQRH